MCVYLLCCVLYLLCECLYLNPSNGEATFFQRTRTQRFWKNIQTLSCWYSLDSSRWVLSDEYPFARVSVIFQLFLHHLVLAKLAASSIKVKLKSLHGGIWQRPQNAPQDKSFMNTLSYRRKLKILISKFSKMLKSGAYQMFTLKYYMLLICTNFI